MKEERDLERIEVLKKVKHLILGEMCEGNLSYIEDDYIIFFAAKLNDNKLFFVKTFNDKCYKILVDTVNARIYYIDEELILKVIEFCNDNLYEVWNSFECVTN